MLVRRQHGNRPTAELAEHGVLLVMLEASSSATVTRKFVITESGASVLATGGIPKQAYTVGKAM